MPYNIILADGQNLTSIADGTIDTTTTSIYLLGYKSTNSGFYLNQNFVNMLQNFAFSSAPQNPLVGQLWFNTIEQAIYVYTSDSWVSLTPPFDGQTGTTVAVIDNQGSEAVIEIVNGNIISISATKSINTVNLLETITVNDTAYAVQSQFPNGIIPGLNMGLAYQIQGNSSTASALNPGALISLSGDANGSTFFTGGSNVVIDVSLNNEYCAPGTYNTVSVDGSGRVTSGSNYLDIDFTGAITGNTYIGNANVLSIETSLSNTGVIAGHYNNVTIDADGRVSNAYVEYQTPICGIVLWPVSIGLFPENFVQCNGQEVWVPFYNSNIITPTMQTFNSCIYLMRIS